VSDEEPKVYFVPKSMLFDTAEECLSSDVCRVRLVMDPAKQWLAVEAVYAYLRAVTGRRHVARPSGKGPMHIMARLNAGFDLADFRLAIDNCWAEWHRNPSMIRFVRAQTIFQPTKFPGYLDGSFAG